MRRNDKAIAPLMQRWREDDYTWAGPKAWACFRPDADVLVPMYYSSTEEGIVSPFAGESVPGLMLGSLAQQVLMCADLSVPHSTAA